MLKVVVDFLVNFHSMRQHLDVRLYEIANLIQHFREPHKEHRIVIRIVQSFLILPVVIVEAFSLEYVRHLIPAMDRVSRSTPPTCKEYLASPK